MSYDIRIKRQDGKTVELRHAHTIIGGTYALGGTSEAWLNITYNYWRIFKELLGANGIRTIYGMNINDARPLLMEAAERLGDVEPQTNHAKLAKHSGISALNVRRHIACIESCGLVNYDGNDIVCTEPADALSRIFIDLSLS